MNAWERLHDSFYLARFDGETWTARERAHPFRGPFTVGVVRPDGLGTPFQSGAWFPLMVSPGQTPDHGRSGAVLTVLPSTMSQPWPWRPNAMARTLFLAKPSSVLYLVHDPSRAAARFCWMQHAWTLPSGNGTCCDWTSLPD